MARRKADAVTERATGMLLPETRARTGREALHCIITLMSETAPQKFSKVLRNNFCPKLSGHSPVLFLLS